MIDTASLTYSTSIDANDLPDPSDFHKVVAIQFKAQAHKLGHRVLAVKAGDLAEQPLYVYRGKNEQGKAMMFQAKPKMVDGVAVPHTVAAVKRTDHLMCVKCCAWAISEDAGTYSGPLAALKRCK